ncbi:MAG: trypsin-like peptidase domain-containing protein [Armatimonadota bacterium]
MKKFLFMTTYIIFLISMCACADIDISAQAKNIVKNYGDAVVSIKAVIEITTSYEGETTKRESKQSATGIIINPNGLLATSIGSLNPSEGFSSRMFDFETSFTQSSEFKDIKVRLADGTEIDYDVKLNDKDLDLMFLLPKASSDKTFPYIDLNNNTTADIMDTVIVLNRMGIVASHSIAVNTMKIQAIIEKPRKLYSASLTSIWENIGGPVFSNDGKVIGLVLTKSAPSESDSTSFFDSDMPVIMPAENIIKSSEHIDKK